jgi:hypothetical protein
MVGCTRGRVMNITLPSVRPHPRSGKVQTKKNNRKKTKKMKIEVERQENVKDIIDVTFPHYFKDCGDVTFSYGKIEETRVTSISEIIDEGDETIEVTIERYMHISEHPYITIFLDKKYQSTKAEFENAKIRATMFLKKL